MMATNKSDVKHDRAPYRGRGALCMWNRAEEAMSI